LSRTADVLRTMSRAAARTLLDELAELDAERAARLREMVNTFDSLALANDRGIQELLRVTETKTLAVALHEEEPQIVDKFLRNLSERARGMLQEEIEFLESVREDDKRTAHQEIMEQALKLEQEDRLSFSEPSDDAGA
jgi:flagellar motor switch protein FliG